MRTPSAKVRVPGPTGPETMAAPTAVFGELSTVPTMSEPCWTLTPPVKVFTPVSTSEPAPCLMMLPLPLLVMMELMFRSFGDRPDVVIVRETPPRSSVPPVMVGVTAKLSFVDVMPPVPVRLSSVPRLMTGLAAVVPKFPLKVIEPLLSCCWHPRR